MEKKQVECIITSTDCCVFEIDTNYKYNRLLWFILNGPFDKVDMINRYWIIIDNTRNNNNKSNIDSNTGIDW